MEWKAPWETRTSHHLGVRDGFDYHGPQVFVEMDSYAPTDCRSMSGILSDTQNTYFMFGNRQGRGMYEYVRAHVVSFTAGADIASRIELASLFRRFVVRAATARAAPSGYDLAGLPCKSASGHTLGGVEVVVVVVMASYCTAT